MVSVTEAVRERRAVRAFLPDSLTLDLVARILTDAARAPSGGNLQPWTVYALTGEPLTRFKADIAARADRGEKEEPQYRVYPSELWEPLRSRRRDAGTQRYAALGITDRDPAGWRDLARRNHDLFGAPVALFFFLDRRVGASQWADLGMFMQSVMLLAVEHDLATCPQASWANWPASVAAAVGAPDTHMLFAGMALGRPDLVHPLANTHTERAELSDFATFIGFKDGSGT